jgi:hypothetical protein
MQWSNPKLTIDSYLFFFQITALLASIVALNVGQVAANFIPGENKPGTVKFGYNKLPVIKKKKFYFFQSQIHFNYINQPCYN